MDYLTSTCESMILNSIISFMFQAHEWSNIITWMLFVFSLIYGVNFLVQIIYTLSYEEIVKLKGKSRMQLVFSLI